MLSWIPLEYDSDAHRLFMESSVIESVARRVDMPCDNVIVGPGHIQLQTVKIGSTLAVSENELTEQSLQRRILDASESLGVFLDSMCLGADPKDENPTVSLYHQSDVNRFRIDRDDPYNIRSLIIEISRFARFTSDPDSRMSVIAHPEFRKYIDPLRKNRIGEDTPIHWSMGCRRSVSGASFRPSGAPLLFVVDSNSLLLGVRSGPEVGSSIKEPSDRLLFRARRAFDVIPDTTFHCVEMV